MDRWVAVPGAAEGGRGRPWAQAGALGDRGQRMHQRKVVRRPASLEVPALLADMGAASRGRSMGHRDYAPRFETMLGDVDGA